MPKLAPDKKLELFQKIFVNHFIRECNLFADIATGRKQADKFDQLLKTISFGLVIDRAVDLMMEPLNTESKAIDTDKLERTGHIDNIYDLLAFSDENWTKQQDELRILIENVAQEMAYRYQYMIVHELSDDLLDSILPLVKVAVERMLEFVARKNLDLTEENLLQGLIEGRSGFRVNKFFNTNLATKSVYKEEIYKEEYGITAEGIFGCSAFRSQNGNYYILEENNATHRKKFKSLKITSQEIQQIIQEAVEEKNKNPPSESKWIKFKTDLILVYSDVFADLTNTQITQFLEPAYDYGYVQFIKGPSGEDIPKYGYVNVLRSLIDNYSYHAASLTKEKKRELDKQYRPIVKITTKKHVSKYLTKIRTKHQSPITFNVYIAKKYKGAKIAACHEDLGDLDLSGGDFSGSDFSRSIISGNLKGTKFNRANLRGATIKKGVSAEGAEFNEAKLEYLNAKGVNFSNIQFNHAHLNYAKLRETNLSGVKAEGACWVEADITNIFSEDSQAIVNQQEKQFAELKEKLKLKTELCAEVEKQSEIVAAVKQELKQLEQTSSEQAVMLQTALDRLLETHDLLEILWIHWLSELASLQRGGGSAETNAGTILGLIVKNFRGTQQDLLALLTETQQLAKQLQGQTQPIEKPLLRRLEMRIESVIETIRLRGEWYIIHLSEQVNNLLAGPRISIKLSEERIKEVEEKSEMSNKIEKFRIALKKMLEERQQRTAAASSSKLRRSSSEEKETARESSDKKERFSLKKFLGRDDPNKGSNGSSNKIVAPTKPRRSQRSSEEEETLLGSRGSFGSRASSAEEETLVGSRGSFGSRGSSAGEETFFGTSLTESRNRALSSFFHDSSDSSSEEEEKAALEDLTDIEQREFAINMQKAEEHISNLETEIQQQQEMLRVHEENQKIRSAIAKEEKNIISQRSLIEQLRNDISNLLQSVPNESVTELKAQIPDDMEYLKEAIILRLSVVAK